MLEHSPYCERDLRAPAEPLLAEGGDVEVYVKHRGEGPGGLTGTVHVVPGAPVRRRRLGRLPLPLRRSTSPTSSRSPGGCTSRRRCTRSSRAPNFVICNFVPRKVDYHPLAVPVPYYHSNVDSDEVMFYVDGDYEARKGSGIGKGSISLHPGGHSHGPQPGAVERSLGAEFFDELAVMVDTFRPLALGEGGTAVGRREVRLVLVGPRTRPREPGCDLPPDTGFGLDNLPYGVFSTAGSDRRRIGVAIGDGVLDLGRRRRPTDGTATGSLERRSWRAGRRPGRRCARACSDWLTDPSAPRRGRAAPHPPTTRSPCTCRSRSPTTSTSTAREQHAENVGRMFRPDAEPLTPNWRHLPIGYHGRAGTVAVSGTPVVRPCGQQQRPDERPDVRAVAGGWTSRPRSASSSATPSPLGTAVPGRRVRRARVRRVPGQRLVGARPPGLGVRAARARSSASRS